MQGGATFNPSVDAAAIARVAEIMHREAGVVLGADKATMISARLRRRLRATGLPDLASYLRFVDSAAGRDELSQLVSALTTNFTHFFREKHHFDFLRDTVVPAWRKSDGAPLRIWSAGCSSGQEPYSIVLSLLAEPLPDGPAPRIAVTASDVDKAIIARARAGVYQVDEMGGLSPKLRSQAFEQCAEGWRVRDAYRAPIQFQQMNLHHDWPSVPPYDVIMCRNVVIYFDVAAQEALWRKFALHLRPGGWLIIGHSERVPDSMRHTLRPVAPTIYQLHAG